MWTHKRDTQPTENLYLTLRKGIPREQRKTSYIFLFFMILKYKNTPFEFLVVHWLGTCLTVQGTWFNPWSAKFRCVTKLWRADALELGFHNKRSYCNEKPADDTKRGESSLKLAATRESSASANGRPTSQPKNKVK